jgi:hypothetical protein
MQQVPRLFFFWSSGRSFLHAAEGGGGTTPKTSGVATLPVIDVWYGNDQQFGVIGTPQRRANILGSVSHPVGISSLKYTLNGGAARTLSFQPDDRRIYQYGDFNIDLKYDELYHGVNTVVITAVATTGDSAQSIVTVRNLSGQIWPLPYSLAWTQFTDSVQIVDGKWAIMGGGARILEPGYDRLIAIGDTTWKNYEVTAKVTVWGIDSSASAFDANNGGPGIGFLLRWKGHTSTPVFSPPISQPLSGYTPSGAIGWYHWGKGYGNPGPNEWQIATGSSNDFAVRIANNANPVYYGAQYYFKAQVNQADSAGPLYKIKAWLVGDTEPSDWLLTWQESSSAMANGSLLLLAHHVMATFGPVTITPAPDGIPPVISDIVASTTPTTATITWTTDEPSKSIVSYGLTSSYGSVAGDPTLVTGHSIQLQNLQPNTLYHYSVTSADFGGASATSWDSTFRTDSLTAPAVVYPDTGASGLHTTVQLSWTRVAGTSAYHVQVGLDSTFASALAFDNSSIVDSTVSVGGLHEGTVYFWRVNATANGVTGPWSITGYFRTVLSSPALSEPPNGTTGAPLNLTLNWVSVQFAISYRLQVGTDSTFSGSFLLDEWNSGATSRAFPTLAEATTYYWRVAARTTQVTSSFSNPWNFTTMQVTVAPTMLQPLNGATGLSTSELFKWMKVTGALTYHLQVATDSTFAGGFVKNDSTIVDTTSSVAGLANKTTYYWRVRAGNVDRWGPFSATWNFHVGTVAVEPEQGLPKSLALEQNYPNPFNPSTTIRYALPQRSPVTLMIYNTLGQNVATLANGEIEAGYHEVKFDAPGLASGVYFYRLTAGTFVETKKLLLVR